MWPAVCVLHLERKVKPIWILMKHEMMGWQWHQLDHMPIICRQINTPAQFFTGRMLFLTPNQESQSTEGNHGTALKTRFANTTVVFELL